MPDRPSFPVPDDLTPETFCLCLQIPNDPTWKAVISGLLFQPAEWFNWQRDVDKSGKTLAQYWRNIYNDIDWSTMSCCCSDPLIQITSDGDILISTDGGVTYHPAGTEDPRKAAPQLPPPTGDDGDAKRCAAANNVLSQFKVGISAFSGYFTTTATYFEFATAVAAIIVSFFLGAIAAIPVIVGIILGLMKLIWDEGKDTFDAAFNDSVYGQLLCVLYDNTPPDGIYTDENITAIRSRISTDFDTIARDAFTALLNGVSTPGMNTMARTPGGSDASCDECGVTAEVWVVNSESGGVYHQVMPVDGVYTVDSEWFTSGHYYANVAFTEDPTDCAVGNKILLTDYSGIDPAAYVLQLRQGDCTSDPLANCYALRQFRSDTPFSISFTLAYPDPCFA